MSDIASLILEAVENAERGLSEARFLDEASPVFDYALFQAWDQLQTAARLLDAARAANAKRQNRAGE
ncbi:MAG: hypothetical protein H2044_01530 [Rhizobiales bacterium]|nr:hypothetical protein [Hyphomicrobiales bacterium]